MLLSKNFIKDRSIYEAVLNIRAITIKANTEALDFFKETHPLASEYEKSVFIDLHYPFNVSDTMRNHYRKRVTSIQKHFENYENERNNKPFMYNIISGVHILSSDLHRYLNKNRYFDFDNFLCFTHFMDYYEHQLRELDNKYANEYNMNLEILRNVTK